jgi:hypothetical protein
LVTCFEVLGAPGAISLGALAVRDIEPSFYNYAFAALFLGIVGMLLMGRFWRGETRIDSMMYSRPQEDSKPGGTCGRAVHLPFHLRYRPAYLTFLLKGQVNGHLGNSLEFLANLLTVVSPCSWWCCSPSSCSIGRIWSFRPTCGTAMAFLGDATRAALVRLRR